ncbi:MAG TPA: MFS transporter [Erysipelotrichaceae bacterium]|nr:MFS transporter [Erysipelotrichaceae bacterium]
MKSSIFDKPLFRARVDKNKVKLFPEGALGYLVGPILALVSNSFISSYLQKYYTDVLGLSTWAPIFLILLQVLSVILVVAGNLLVGRLMNKLNTRAGKARPLLLISLPLIVLAFFVMFFFTPMPVEAGGNANLVVTCILVALGYNLYFSIGYPLYYTSHSALVGLSTRDSKARGLLATLSNASALGAMGVCTMILPFFIGTIFDEPSRAYEVLRWVALVLVAVTIIGTILEFAFTRERISEEQFEDAASKVEEEEKKEEISVSKQWKVSSKDKFWWIMIIFFFLYQLGGMIKNCSQLYYCNAIWGAANDDGILATTIKEVNNNGGAKSGLLAILGAIPTALGMLVVWPLSNKIGKARLILIGGILAVIGGVLGLFAGDNFILAVIAFVIKALGGAPAMYISLALLADVSDHQEAKHGFRCDGLSMAIYGAIMVGMTGIANGIISGVLSAVGYNTDTVAGMTSAAVGTAMTWLFFGGETICYAVIALMFLFMNVEKFSKEDHEIIEARKEKK